MNLTLRNYAIADYFSRSWSTKLKSDFCLSPTYSNGTDIITSPPEASFYATAVDIDGRLISLRGQQIFRIIG